MLLSVQFRKVSEATERLWKSSGVEVSVGYLDNVALVFIGAAVPTTDPATCVVAHALAVGLVRAVCNLGKVAEGLLFVWVEATHKTGNNQKR